MHRPRTEDPRFKAMAPAEASVAYKGILDDISRHLEEMEAPRAAIDAMVATSSSEIRWVDYDRDGLERSPSIAEWTDPVARLPHGCKPRGFRHARNGLAAFNHVLAELAKAKLPVFVQDGAEKGSKAVPGLPSLEAHSIQGI